MTKSTTKHMRRWYSKLRYHVIYSWCFCYVTPICQHFILTYIAASLQYNPTHTHTRHGMLCVLLENDSRIRVKSVIPISVHRCRFWVDGNHQCIRFKMASSKEITSRRLASSLSFHVRLCGIAWRYIVICLWRCLNWTKATLIEE